MEDVALYKVTKENAFSIDKKLSREQKISILLRARDMIENKERACICPAIKESFNRLHILLVGGGGVYIPWREDTVLEKYPRLLDFKPKNKKKGESWFNWGWSGRRKRVKIFKHINQRIEKRIIN